MEIVVFDFDALRTALSRILLRIEVSGYIGTGFFISEKGYVLTAFHNIPAAVRQNPETPIPARFHGQLIDLRWLLSSPADAEWQQRLDIAVLQGPAGAVQPEDLVKLAYLDPTVERPERAVFWRGRQVALMGYPARSNFEEELVLGNIRVDEPVQDVKLFDDTGRQVALNTGALAFGDDFQKNCQMDIKGVSGGPIYDTLLKAIIAVQYAAWPERQRVYATELSYLAQLWPPFAELAHGFPLPPPAPRGVAGKIVFDSYIEDKTRNFMGREWLVSKLDNFIKTRPSGYFILRGDPGIGKTSFSALLAAGRKYIHHFNISTLGVTTQEQFVANVSARLIERYCPREPEPDPKQCQSGTYLLDLLKKISRRLKPEEEIVIVVDALDEAQQTSMLGANVLALPSELPPGIFVFATVRLLDEREFPLWVQASREDFTLDARGAENSNDIRRMVESAVERAELRRRIKAAGMSIDDFVALLLERSEGNFMYLSSVLGEVERGDLEPAADALPQGLKGYYLRHWRRMRGGDRERWENVLLPVILVLAVALEPLSVREIQEFISEELPDFAKLTRNQVRSVVREWRQFLTEVSMDNQVCYRIYHKSFQDFLAEQDEVRDVVN